MAKRKRSRDKNATEPNTSRTPPSDFHSSEEDIYMLCTPNTKTVPSSAEKSASRKLTPKQIALRLHREKTRALKEQEKEEKRLQLQKEKDEKAREKEEQERQRRKEREEKEEQKRKEREEKEDLKRKERLEKEQAKQKEREEKEEQRRKEREEKEKRRQDEVEQKLEEKRLKDEERRRKEEQKEEERKRRDEEKEAEEKKKQKVAEAFTSFFVKKPSAATSGVLKASDDENSLGNLSTGGEGMEVALSTGTGTPPRFMPFCVKGDMRLAPTTRAILDSTQKTTLDAFLEERSFVALKPALGIDKLYLGELTSRCHNPRTSGKTWNTEEEEDENDMMIGDDETVCHQIEEDPEKMKQRFKVKFFLFDENQRPPYRGTWRKRSQQISARRPFALDTKFFDYDVDSDDEWEEEEPGESLHGSDDEKDVDHEEDYEVDNEFFVPHGHLSDEELQAEGEDADGNPELDDNRPQVQKAKLKILQQEFVAEMKKKTEKIKPRLIGCIWENGGYKTGHTARPDCSAIIWKMLTDRAMLYDPAEPISFTLPSAGPTNDSEADPEAQSPGKENEKGPKRVRITDDAVCDLMRLVHGNTNKSKFLVREFQAFWRNLNTVTFSLESIHLKIREVASWGVCTIDGPMLGKLCWTVDDEILKMHKLTTLILPNEWKYSLEGNNQARRHAAKRRAQEETQETGQQADESVRNKDPARKKVKHSNGHVTLKTQSVPNAPATVSITKFTKKLSADEKKKMLTGSEKNSPKQRDALEVPETVTSPKPVDSKPIKMGATPSPTLKKRAQLLSVPRLYVN
ncbi:chromatin assembly factor 1 subunit A-like [Anopheles cruzii]|uniref:chromatin assembly factor 1 subunit A-like n=1 Tax=Anopheles cruzii TaxID=68878 RepID=UPI0022EC8F1B|nr:chromatin assembly factor 1 subunit A-like [Anopheles cruzii]